MKTGAVIPGRPALTTNKETSMNNYYTQENHGPFQLIDIGRLDLEEGGVLEHCELAVATHGHLVVNCV